MENLNQRLPEGIISDILTRLPTEQVMETKLVCKTWNNLIHHPSFPKMHLARLNQPDSPDSGKLRYVISKLDDDIDDDDYDFDLDRRIYYFEYNDNEDWNSVAPIHRKISIEPSSFCEAYILIGSFNGLICIYGTRPSFPDVSGPAIIFNPVTKEYIVLPDFDFYPEYETKGKDAIRCSHLACGFGYLAETDEYKVVRIYNHGGETTVVEVEVYTVGSGKGWRHVGKFDLGFIFYTLWEHTHGAFLNGAFYWKNAEGGMVVVFDLADEKFRRHIPPPPLPIGTLNNDDYASNIVLGVSGGGILYYAFFDEIWLFMKKKNNLETEEHHSWGWVKIPSLEQKEPFAYTEDGAAIRYDQGNVKIFVSETSTWESCDEIFVDTISRQVFRHQHTLVSLKDLGEEDAEIMKPLGIEETDSSESASDKRLEDKKLF